MLKNLILSSRALVEDLIFRKHRSITLFGMIACVVFSLSSCGFQTIYRDEENNFSYAEDLVGIRIKKDRDRLSQELKNNLYDLFNPDYIKSEPKYLLILRTNKGVSGTLITQTGASGRNRVSIDASYELKNLENGVIISRGYTSANDSYDVSKNRYGTYVADETVQLNLTKIVAQNIRNTIVNDFIEVRKKCSGETAAGEEEYEVALDANEMLLNDKQRDPMRRSTKIVKEKFVCPFKKQALVEKSAK